MNEPTNYDVAIATLDASAVHRQKANQLHAKLDDRTASRRIRFHEATSGDGLDRAAIRADLAQADALHAISAALGRLADTLTKALVAVDGSPVPRPRLVEALDVSDSHEGEGRA